MYICILYAYMVCVLCCSSGYHDDSGTGKGPTESVFGPAGMKEGGSE